MSKKIRGADLLQHSMTELDNMIREHGVPLSDGVIRGTYSQEGIAEFEKNFEDQVQGLHQDMATVIQDVDKNLIGDNPMSLEDASESVRAGLIAYAASQQPARYAKAAVTYSKSGAMSMESLHSGLGGQLDVANVNDYSQESFDSPQLANFTTQNIFFNVLASRQDQFAEGFFPTKVMTPAEGGIEITVDRQETIDYGTHKSDGSLTDFNRRNLMNAFRDHEIISKPATELVPYRKTDNSVDEYFVSDNFVSDRSRDIEGVSVTTRPLKIGKRMNFLSLTQHPGLMDSGVYDITDQIAPGMKLSRIYLGLTLTGTPDTYETLSFDVAQMGRNEFKKSHEGRNTEVILNFTTKTLTVGPSKQTIGGATPTMLDDVIMTPGYTVQLGVTVQGNANLNTGELEVNAGSVRVEAAYDTNGEAMALDAGDGLAIVDRFENRDARIVGYELGARRSNSNWRSIGTVIDVTPYTESFAVQPGYPISVLTPTEDTQSGAKISGMVNAARIRNSNNAVTTLLNYAEQLASYTDALNAGVEIDIIGAARHVVTPFYEKDQVDVQASTETISSHDRFIDISRVIVDRIRNMAYRMYRNSNYTSALNLATSGAETKPTVLIGCDEVTAQYLNVESGGPLLGENMDHRVVTTPDKRIDGKIFLTFTREQPGSEDGLTFGVHAYIPELIQRVTTSRQGETATNDRVIPRSIHVPVLPILGELDVVNLEAAVANEA